jgi:hypothetical protein
MLERAIQRATANPGGKAVAKDPSEKTRRKKPVGKTTSEKRRRKNDVGKTTSEKRRRKKDVAKKTSQKRRRFCEPLLPRRFRDAV